jgi:hypothetical protein
MNFYTGVGSRKTPTTILNIMQEIAVILYKRNFILRSGGANGADKAFESGAAHLKMIYLPWKGFNNSESILYTVDNEALSIAKQIHPAWERCSSYAKLLHGRNVYQVLGQNLNVRSKFIICWTKNGILTGGTATAIRLGIKNDIPVYNLGYPGKIKEIYNLIER